MAWAEPPAPRAFPTFSSSDWPKPQTLPRPLPLPLPTLSAKKEERRCGDVMLSPKLSLSWARRSNVWTRLRRPAKPPWLGERNSGWLDGVERAPLPPTPSPSSVVVVVVVVVVVDDDDDEEAVPPTLRSLALLRRPLLRP